MSVGFAAAAPKTVIPSKPKKFSQGNLNADGSEQLLVEYVGTGKLFGSVNLSEMSLGDTIILRQYIKLIESGLYQKYADESYSGTQSNPVIYFLEKATDVAIKITLQQANGIFRTYEHNFMVED